MTLDIVGGTYYEVCRDPHWEELYGSGLRAAHALSKRHFDVVLHTCIGDDFKHELEFSLKSINVKLQSSSRASTISFIYDHPLDSPKCEQDLHEKSHIKVQAKSILQFGMMEANCMVIGESVVYDPQSPNKPQSFWSNLSHASKLIWVCNMQEAIAFTGETSLDQIKDFMFTKEKVYAMIIKNGTEGALLLRYGDDDFTIPAYKTDNVWPIGTGDIFTAIFTASYLIDKLTLEESAILASQSTAYYSNSRTLPIPPKFGDLGFEPHLSQNIISNLYLAGPFFNMGQRWVLEQFRTQFLKMGLKVFSPFHDVGLGSAQEVYEPDIEALKNSNMVIAILDSPDEGTIFEVGYARALNIPVLIFGENISKESFTMMIGSSCKFESDFSTAIYKTMWMIKNEK